MGELGKGWQTRSVSESPVVSLRPRKARIVAGVAAVAVLAVFSGVGFALRGPVNTGPATFGTGDRVAMVLLGVLGALGVLTLARPRVDADARGIRVRNLLGGYQLPWSAVRAVCFARGSAWATLELADDDVLAVMAVQATDKEYAVEGVRALRALHAAATAPGAGAGTTSAPTGSASIVGGGTGSVPGAGSASGSGGPVDG